jgi:hypothetical protein
VVDLVNVGGGENWDASFAGGGPAESASQLVKAIEGHDAFSMAANGVALGFDLLGVIESPIRTLATSVIGWLLEHISFLDSFLDYTTGDPIAIEAAVKALNAAATDLDELAAEHINALSQVPTYAEGGSGSFNAFFERVMPRAEDIKAQSLACAGLSSGMTVDGIMVSTCRGVIRDALANVVLRAIVKGTAALAAAPYTGGGSMATAIYDIALDAARTAKELGDVLSRVGVDLADMSGKLERLVDVLGTSVAKNYLTSSAKGADMSEARPELTAADEAKARRQQAEESATPAFPWRVQGTLDDG